MTNIFRRLSTAIHQLSRGLRFLGQLALGGMVLTICYDVVMRYVFAAPTMWSLEVNTFLVVFVAVIPAADVLRSNAHLRISFFLEKLPSGLRCMIERVTAFCGVVFCGFMTWKGFLMAMQAFQYNERMSTSLGTPLVIPYLFLPIGFGVLGAEYLIKLIEGPEGLTAQ